MPRATRAYEHTGRGPAIIKAQSSNKLSDAYRDAIMIRYQYLGLAEPSTEFDWGGETYDTPIMAGPIMGYSTKNEEGPVAFGRAMRDAGSIFWMSSHDQEGWERVLAAGIPAVHVIKPFADNGLMVDLIERDTELGAVGYATDIDHGFSPYGAPDRQDRPFSSKTEAELRELAEASPLPFYAKGVLTVRDALIAQAAGATGIVISNHNNRFPCAIPPLMALPEIRAAVGEDFRILVDGGLNSGYDVFKALALGADGTLCARGLLASFSKDGEEGLQTKVLEMTAELKGAMAATGSSDLAHINRDAIVLP